MDNLIQYYQKEFLKYNLKDFIMSLILEVMCLIVVSIYLKNIWISIIITILICILILFFMIPYFQISYRLKQLSNKTYHIYDHKLFFDKELYFYRKRYLEKIKYAEIYDYEVKDDNILILKYQEYYQEKIKLILNEKKDLNEILNLIKK